MNNRILFGLGHPAHFHLYKNVIQTLIDNGYKTKIVISEKDILVDLMNSAGFQFETIASSNFNENAFQKANKLIKSTRKLIKITEMFKPKLLIGCLSQIAWVGYLKRIPSVFNAEDDIDYTYLQAIITYPFIKHILSPEPTNVGFFKRKKISYAGYHKLAYLHPKRFQLDENIVYSKIPREKFTIIRLVNLNAYHDINAKGISQILLMKLIKSLEKHGNVYITSETPLTKELEKYKLNINPIHIHHFLAAASLFVGDSQSMAVEAAILGTPCIKYNDFAGKISVLEELEKKYKLTIGLNTRQESQLFSTIEDILRQSKEEYQLRKETLLKEKIDVSAFFQWFIENYPNSAQTMKENPDYQYKFK